jgi:hypothetical protein
VNLLTLPIVSGTIAGISLTLLILVLVLGRKKADPPRAEETSALGSWEDHLPARKR